MNVRSPSTRLLAEESPAAVSSSFPTVVSSAAWVLERQVNHRRRDARCVRGAFQTMSRAWSGVDTTACAPVVTFPNHLGVEMVPPPGCQPCAVELPLFPVSC